MLKGLHNDNDENCEADGLSEVPKDEDEVFAPARLIVNSHRASSLQHAHIKDKVEENTLEYYDFTKENDSRDASFEDDCYSKNRNSDISITNNVEGIRKRHKTQEEVSVLEAYFKVDPTWGRRTVKELKYQLPALTVDQIYKWGYDHKVQAKHKTAKKKAKNVKFEETEIDISVLAPIIDDYNKEVENLWKFNHESNVKLNSSAKNKIDRLKKFHKSMNSFVSKETLPTCNPTDDLIEDDPFFYDEKENAYFYVVNRDSTKVIPHRVVGKKGLFRIPSGFFNLDFYTYRDEAFQNNVPEFLSELKNKE